MGRTENINVFQDTMNLCKNNDRIRESVHNSAEGQKLILEEDAIVESDKNRYKEKARITVSAKRKEAYSMSDKNPKHPLKKKKAAAKINIADHAAVEEAREAHKSKKHVY